MMKSISGVGMRLLANAFTFAALAIMAQATDALGQSRRVFVRGVPDSIGMKMDSSPMADKERRTAVVRRVDSLLRLQNDTPIGSPDYARIQRDLETSVRSIIPGGSALIGTDGTFSIMIDGTQEMRRNALTAPRVTISAAPRGWIGVDLDGFHRDPWREADGIYVQYFEYPTVVGVDPASPAAKGGVKFGDLLLAYDGIDLRRNAINLTRLLEPGRTLAVKLRRESKTKELSIVVEKAPAIAVTRAVASGGFLAPSREAYGDSDGRVVEAQARAGPVEREWGFGGAAIAPGATSPMAMMIPNCIAGARMTDMDSSVIAAWSHQKATHGVVVTSVSPGSPAARLGLTAGDIIVSADHGDVTSLSQLYHELRTRPANRSTVFVVLRQGKFEALAFAPR